MFFKGKIDWISAKLNIDIKSPNYAILKDVVKSATGDEEATETLESIQTFRDLFNLYKTQKINELVYKIAFEEDENNSVRNKLLNANDTVENIVDKHLLQLAKSLNTSKRQTINLFNVLGNDCSNEEVARYILDNCGVVKKDNNGCYGFESVEFRAYMNANVTLQATVDLANKVNKSVG